MTMAQVGPAVRGEAQQCVEPPTHAHKVLLASLQSHVQHTKEGEEMEQNRATEYMASAYV
jgi:hypothetical protein